jgi:hypothetical protein
MTSLPGTLQDVAQANLAAKKSADALGSPSPEYSAAMSRVVQGAVVNARHVGARLDMSI